MKTHTRTINTRTNTNTRTGIKTITYTDSQAKIYTNEKYTNVQNTECKLHGHTMIFAQTYRNTFSHTHSNIKNHIHTQTYKIQKYEIHK